MSNYVCWAEAKKVWVLKTLRSINNNKNYFLIKKTRKKEQKIKALIKIAWTGKADWREKWKMNNFYIPSKVEEGKDMNDVFQRKLTVYCDCVLCILYIIFVPHQDTSIGCPTVCPVYFVDLKPRRAGASPDKRTRWKSQVIRETQTVYVLTLCYILRAVVLRGLRWTS